MSLSTLITDVQAYNAKRDALSHPSIPEDVELFQHRNGYAKPETVHGWEWSYTFGKWSALVTFADGWNGFTYPRPALVTPTPESEAFANAFAEDTDTGSKCTVDATQPLRDHCTLEAVKTLTERGCPVDLLSLHRMSIADLYDLYSLVTRSN